MFKVTFHKGNLLYMTETFEAESLNQLRQQLKPLMAYGWKVLSMHQLVPVDTDWFDAEGALIS
jgi:hypothetical protein